MSNSPDPSMTESLFAPHPAYGRYVSHHPSRRIMLLVRGGIIYALAIVVLQALFWNVPDNIAAIFLPMLFAGIAAAIFWYILHLWNREVVLYEHGFTYREGSRTGQFFYADITQIRQNIEQVRLFGIIPQMVYDYKMTSKHDESLTITYIYSDTQKLLNRLDKFITRDRLPMVRMNINDGKPEWFGDAFKLSKEGIEHDGMDVFWHEITGIRSRDAHLIIQTKTDEQWARVPVPEIDNVVMMIAIVKALAPELKQAKANTA